MRINGGHEHWFDVMICLALDHAQPRPSHASSCWAVETGQRGSDIIKMRWSDIENQTDPMSQPT
jgi:hypothetical protein